ncbi:MAG: M14 family zinc carboxypeptidase, partial [Bryobacteraceae bacterium]
MIRLLAVALAAALAALAAVPTPAEHLGYAPGADYKLADYSDIIGYFQKLARASDRIRLVEFGKTSLGKPMYVAFLSSAENLKQLDRYRAITRRLALGEATEAEARKLAADGRAIVWIDSGLHATEVAPVQHAPELAYRMVAAADPETEGVRRSVILMQVPCINPDGLDMVARWYRRNVGTPFEIAPLPTLYQKYAGHDNNRDWFMLNLAETRAVTRLLFREWFPHIVYNQHQTAPFPARIFVPPYAEPLNPHIPAPVMEGINLIGSAMKERFARENKPGVLSYHNFDAWWNGGLRTAPAFHNMHGILTETALHLYATPRVYSEKELPAAFSSGIPTREPTVFYQRPWLGGRWAIRDAIDYMLTADFGILAFAASRPAEFLFKSWQLARASIDRGNSGGPFAYVVAPDQHDRPTAVDMLDRLSQAGVDVRRARAGFQAGGATFAEGSYVLLAAQPFRPYLVDLMEPQKYPELRAGQSGPTKRPYDITGWTLPLNMGVRVDRVDDAFTADLEPATQLRFEGAVRGSGSVVTLDRRENNSFRAVSALL